MSRNCRWELSGVEIAHSGFTARIELPGGTFCGMGIYALKGEADFPELFLNL